MAAHYDAAPESAERRATFAVLVDNEPGVLHRLVGLFSARGYNIESLTVAETDHGAHVSRVTVVSRGTENILAQIQAQLEKMVAVRAVVDVSRDSLGLERELALFKVRGAGNDRLEALRLAEIFRAKVIDTTLESFIFEITGASDKIDQFEALMRPLGLVEVSRTGVLSIRRGADR
jgi:acetolactate synthase-1/3 small subunit